MTELSLQFKYDKILSYLHKKVGKQLFNMWLRDTTLLSFSPEKVVIGVPNLFLKEWIEKKFSNIIKEAFENVVGVSPLIKIVIEGELFRKYRKQQRKDNTIDPEVLSRKLNFNKLDTPSEGFINPSYTLDTFVAAGRNMLPYLVARQFVDNIYSSLFKTLLFYGESGNGKTHLLKGIYHEIRNKYPHMKVKYTTAERFFNDFLIHMREKKLDEFRQKYRSLDIFILDDLHFLENKKGTQRELLHTFKELESCGKIIVCASIPNPIHTKGLSPELIKWTTSGMMVEVKRPCLEGRIAILKATCKKSPGEFPDSLIRWLAQNTDCDTRTLIGTMIKIIGYAALNDTVPNIEIARQICFSTTSTTHFSPSTAPLDKIVEKVAANFNLSKKDIIGKNQSRNVAFVRQIAMYIIRKKTSLPYANIGKFFGNRKYTTVIYAERKIENILKKDNRLKSIINTLLGE